MSDRILGAVCVVVGAGMAWAAQGYAAEISYEPVGPRAFPLLLSALMVACGAWLVVRPGVAATAEGDGAGAEAARWQNLKPLALAVLAIGLYVSLFQWLGFPLATALMALPVGMAFGGNWRQSLAAGAGMGVVLYLMFDKLLDVILPTGLLSFILGGR
ncbi:MAG: tripartite tricarboxylate transporter TctB family protein [Gammaproteobacteria bacterium]|nr:tripartite tricarboxylate transporter TctB family protein [Gammaproteobacteria bacterium]MBU1504825.1 tripartite tricarboxylate transporter TctB family protein [Gammaproteobacteria bacterium]MBU2122464.1 tripartite tricarboxylate transporter TctB family protein [Gammaproteobacteria bacterium]MBU2172132.1 tripartite tricarboxylate transporter TctB family protein [Gammaproteobacteria bacterium]MBU2198876.1 tripartite tricarboxylate transporter TctB family protein [Gammaproteobacteria bacterium